MNPLNQEYLGLTPNSELKLRTLGKAQSCTILYYFECQMYSEIRAVMLNQLANYCVPDLNTVLVGIHTSGVPNVLKLVIISL